MRVGHKVSFHYFLVNRVKWRLAKMLVIFLWNLVLMVLLDANHQPQRCFVQFANHMDVQGSQVVAVLHTGHLTGLCVPPTMQPRLGAPPMCLCCGVGACDICSVRDFRLAT